MCSIPATFVVAEHGTVLLLLWEQGVLCNDTLQKGWEQSAEAVPSSSSECEQGFVTLQSISFRNLCWDWVKWENFSQCKVTS